MHKFVWASLAATTLAALALFWTIKATIQYKPTLPRNVPRNISREQLEEIKQLGREERSPSPRPASRAAVDASEFDFGTLDPGATSNHVFVIRNDGLEPLMLGDPQPSCSCAGANFSRRLVPPGESAELNIAWTVGDKQGPFSVGLTLPTSDPQHNSLYFRIAGRVRVQLAALPNAFVVGDLTPDEISTPHETFVYSETWDQFEIDELSCSIPGATCTVVPATAVDLRAQPAKSGYRVRLTLPADLPTGPISGELKFSARTAASEQPLPYTMGIAGQVRGRLSIHGSAIDPHGIIDLGTFARGEGRLLRLIVKVRDADKDLRAPRFEIEPSYITARLVEQGATPGLYALEINVPKDAPAEVHLRSDQWGTLTLLTDHPRIPSTKLRLRFAVTDRTLAKVD